jgi:hypothetical protein
MVIPALLRQTVINRAGNRCEYCTLSQFAQEASFHIDHIIPQSAGGPTTLENLALACVTCSLRKGARQTVMDMETGLEFPVFNPRRDLWQNHFRWVGLQIIGVTAMGRATTSALQMNRAHIIAIRNEERLRGRLPMV